VLRSSSAPGNRTQHNLLIRQAHPTRVLNAMRGR